MGIDGATGVIIFRQPLISATTIPAKPTKTEMITHRSRLPPQRDKAAQHKHARESAGGRDPDETCKPAALAEPADEDALGWDVC
jgi:hypothetical protein